MRRDIRHGLAEGEDAHDDPDGEPEAKRCRVIEEPPGSNAGDQASAELFGQSTPRTPGSDSVLPDFEDSDQDANEPPEKNARINSVTDDVGRVMARVGALAKEHGLEDVAKNFSRAKDKQVMDALD